MNNRNRKEKKSKLESFPDELFIELFSYIKPVDLYTGFVNLNYRIDAILHDIQIHISIDNDNQYVEHQQCMEYFANQVTYLAIGYHWSCLYDHICLRRFSNLRSLHLPKPNKRQSQEIYPEYLPHLIHLTINDNGFKSILSRSSKFSNLRTCCIPRVYSSVTTQINPLQLCFTLQTLSLYSCSMKDLFHLFQYVPNLKYLQVILTSMAENNQDIKMKHENISRLKVTLQQLHPDLDTLLKSMGNLSELKFIWHTKGGYSTANIFDFRKLFSILNQYSTSLKYVDFDLYFSYEHRFVGRVQSFDPEQLDGIWDADEIWRHYTFNLRTLKQLSSNVKKETN